MWRRASAATMVDRSSRPRRPDKDGLIPPGRLGSAGNPKFVKTPSKPNMYHRSVVVLLFPKQYSDRSSIGAER